MGFAYISDLLANEGVRVLQRDLRDRAAIRPVASPRRASLMLNEPPNLFAAINWQCAPALERYSIVPVTTSIVLIFGEPWRFAGAEAS